MLKTQGDQMVHRQSIKIQQHKEIGLGIHRGAKRKGPNDSNKAAGAAKRPPAAPRNPDPVRDPK